MEEPAQRQSVMYTLCFLPCQAWQAIIKTIYLPTIAAIV